MLGSWEYNLNKVDYDRGDFMTLNDIISTISAKKKNLFALSKDYKTIRYIDGDTYEDVVGKYVEPQFSRLHRSECGTPRFIIFSAPGATGKSTLAMHICHEYNGIYWNLPDNKIAEFSFQGAIAKAVGFQAMSNFIGKLVNGETFLVIDAFDEAEASSGRSGVEFFLRDLENVVGMSSNMCAILMARTESAIFIREFLEKNNVPYEHYEIGYFSEDSAKKYIKNRLARDNAAVTPVINSCIENQFAEIHRIFSEKEAMEFLGYAPVLDALEKSLIEVKNTINILQDTASGENNCKIMFNIFDRILDREQMKFVNALKNKFDKHNIEINFDEVYTRSEQIGRIIGMKLINDTTLFSEISDTIPDEYKDDYMEVVNSQLPQHPFILAKNKDNAVEYVFSGPAFRDYVVACGLAAEDMKSFIDEWLEADGKYYPSQMLIEFYGALSKNKISGMDIPLMYNSFKAHARVGEETSLTISGDSDDCYAGFRLNRMEYDPIEMDFTVCDVDNGIRINQITNCYIDVDGDVYVGNTSDVARINNSYISCSRLYWGSNQILIEAYSPGTCTLFADQFASLPNVTPRFDVKADKPSNLKVSANNINSYYKLLSHKSDRNVEDNADDFTVFATVIRRIFNSLRCHSKDTPARKSEYIDNKIIGTSKKKKQILESIMKEGIIFTDDQGWLYKLDRDKLAEFKINWNDVKNGEFSTLNDLYCKIQK